MKSFINFLINVNIWLIFIFSVAGAVFFSILLGFLLNYFFYDGTNNLVMLGSVVIPLIVAPVIISLFIITIKELRKSRMELDQKVAQRTRELEDTYAQLRQEVMERKEIEKKLLHAHKMEAIGTLAGGIAHDFNNILSTILGYAQIAKHDAPPGSSFADDLDKVLIAANRAKDLVTQILAFSRQSNVERIPMKVQTLLKEALKMLRPSIPTTIKIKQDIDPDSKTIVADPTQVHQIIMNLCTNAYHAMEETGGLLSIELKTSVIDTEAQCMELQINPGEYVELSVRDTGSGIESDVIGKIFDPYFTTKEAGKGTGMGLAITYGIITDYGGTITVESVLGEGTTFHVFFPAADQESLPVAKEPEVIPSGTERILFVDDDEILAEMSKDMLERLGYIVTEKRSSFEALEAFKKTPDAFDVIITDQTMPGMIGSDLARRMLQIRPDIPIILCTGFSNLIDENSAKMIGIKEFALKPLTMETIAKLIRKALDKNVPVS